MRLELGDECPRCDGRGEVYDEVFEYEWASCPYFDFDRRIGCLNGVVATEGEINAARPFRKVSKTETRSAKRLPQGWAGEVALTKPRRTEWCETHDREFWEELGCLPSDHSLGPCHVIHALVIPTDPMVGRRVEWCETHGQRTKAKRFCGKGIPIDTSDPCHIVPVFVIPADQRDIE